MKRRVHKGVLVCGIAALVGVLLWGGQGSVFRPTADKSPEQGSLVADGALSLNTEDVAALAEEIVASSELAGYPLAQSIQHEEYTSTLTDLARAELVAYQESSEVALVQAGYLDLLGRVWSCTVQGGTWAETCLVAEQAAGDSCVVWRIRTTAA